MGRYEAISMSPDGTRIAYCILTPPSESLSKGLTVEASYLLNGTPLSSVGLRLAVTETRSGKTTMIGSPTANSFRASWSPDSKALAFFSDAGGAAQLWMYHVCNKTTRRISTTPVHPSVWTSRDPSQWISDSPVWHPNGQEVYVRLRSSQTNAALLSRRAVTNKPPAIRAYTTEEQPRQNAPVPNLESAQTNFDATHGADLAAIAVQSGAVRRLVVAGKSPQPGLHRVSASGKWLAYLSTPHISTNQQPELTCDLMMVSTQGGKLQSVATHLTIPDTLYGGTYRWHPKRDVLVYVKDKQLWLADFETGVPKVSALAPEMRGISFETLAFTRDGNFLLAGMEPTQDTTGDALPESLMLIPLDKGSPLRLNEPENALFQQALMANENTLYQPELETVIARWRDTKTNETLLIQHNYRTGKNTLLHKELSSFEFVNGGQDHQHIACLRESISVPPDLYLFSGTLQKPPLRLSSVEPRLDTVAGSSLQIFETTVARQGASPVSARMGLILPKGAKQGDKLPTLVWVYGGGAYSVIAERFGGGKSAGLPHYLFTSKGYAILIVDTPIGAQGIAGNPLREITEVLLPQLRRADELGYCDINRMAILGQSYGGYSAAGVITQTNLFKAAVALAGVYDLLSASSTLRINGMTEFEAYETGQFRMGTHPWKERQRYLDNSPYHLADKIQTPLMLVHGEKDTLPVEEVRKMFVACKRLGKTAELVIYSDEEHTVRSSRNAMDLVNRMLGFLQKYLPPDKAGKE